MDKLDKITFTIRDKELTLYKTDEQNVPLIIFNNFENDGQIIFDNVKKYAIYSMYNCKVFDYVASIFGSLWFPDFKKYLMTNEIMYKPQKIYLSLGDLESKTKNKILSTVYDNTNDIVKYYKELGLNVEWEINKGNHFMDVDERCVKGIGALIK